MATNDFRNKILVTDYLDGFSQLDDESIDMIVTSPPYWQAREYDGKSDLGLESSPQEYVEHLRPLFRESMRVLRPYGGFWFNIGDARSQGSTRQRGRRDTTESRKSEAFSGWSDWEGDLAANVPVEHGVPRKSFLGIPEMFLFMALEEGFRIRDKIIWAKGVAYYDGRSYGGTTPSPARDRFATAWEPVYYLTKDHHNYFNYDAIKFEAKSRKGYKMPTNVIVVPPAAGKNFKGKQKNFATYPPALTDLLIAAGTPPTVCQQCGVPTPMKPDYKAFDGCEHFENMWESAWGNGIVLDPFMGSGTTAVSAVHNGVDFIGFDVHEGYVEDAKAWVEQERNSDG